MSNAPTINKLSPPKSADELLTLYFEEARYHLLETAAILDRIERAENGGETMKDERIKKLKHACDILTKESGNRAEQFLLHFSEK